MMRMLSRGNTVEACRSLLAARQRSILALIGIAVGVAAVSTMMSVGLVVKTRALEQFRELGTEVMTIRVRNEKRAHGPVNLTLEEAANVTSTPAVLSAAPYTISSQPLILSAATPSKGTVIGATGEFAELARLRLRAGRFVSVLDGTQYFCTVGSDIAEALGGAAAIGRTVRIGDAIHEVIGVLERVGGSQRAVDVNGSVFVPIEDASRVTPRATLRNIFVKRDADTDYREAARQIEAYFRGIRPRAKVSVRSPEELIEGMQRQMRLYTLLLGSVSAIALLVGGIGVMNIMLAAVAERRTEIGVRRALGARKRDVRDQILVESLILSLAGGVVGVGIGAGATWAICSYNGWAYQVSIPSFALGLSVACGTGVLFALFPARQAANMEPVEALRAV